MTKTVEEVLKRVKGAKKKAKGTPAPKRTPCFIRYKHADRGYHHQMARITAHVERNPNDKPAASALTRIRNRKYGA